MLQTADIFLVLLCYNDVLQALKLASEKTTAYHNPKVHIGKDMNVC